MSNEKQTRRVTRASRDTLIRMLEALPDAFFVVDDADTIVYANASAQAMTGAPPEALRGNSFWRCAPQLVSTALYQAVRKTRQTRVLTEVEYISPVTQTWLHVHLAPTVGGLTLQFQQGKAAARRQEMFAQGECLCIDDLDGLHTRIGILTPEGIVLEINEVPLDDAQVRREEVIGKPLAEAPWWSFSPASQEQLRTAIAQASRGETARFDALLRPREGMLLSFESVITPHIDADHHIGYLVIAGIDITARKRAEAEIHALIDAIPQLVWTGRPDGYVDSYNQRWRDYTGLTTEQAQGDGWMQCTHPDDWQRVLAVWQRAVQTGGPYETEQRLRHGTTGVYRWFLMQATPYKDAQGTILKYVGTCTDIDEQKRAEQRLKTSEENWRVLAETVPQLVWTTRPDGQHEYANQRWCDYMGLTVEHMQSDRWAPLPFIHPDDREGTRALWQHALDTGEMYEHEERFRNSQTGAYRWFLARAMPVRDETGQVVKWFGTCTDIEDQKQAEQKIKESEENWRVLAETVPQFVWIGQPAGSKEYYNQRWFDYAHAAFEQLQGDGWLEFLHPDDYERTLALRRHARETGEPYEIENRLKDGKTGSYRWFLTRGVPVRDDTGQIVKWFGMVTDIEDQKQAEQKIKESEENWRVLAETVPQLVWTTSPDGLVEYWSHRWYDYSGSSPTQSLGHGWSQFLHPDDTEHTLTVWHHALETGEPYEINYRLKDGKTGSYRWFLVRGMPVRDDSGQIVKWFGTCTDIEDQKRIEEALRQSQERVNFLMNSSIIGTFVSEEDQIVEANETYLCMTGYTQEDLRAGHINWVRMTPPEYAAQTQHARQELAVSYHVTRYEKEYICKNGSRLPVVVGVVALRLDPLQAIGFVLDNSAHKELEQRKDDFISMASHELRTPLTALKLQTQLVRKRLEKQSHHEAATALSRVEVPIQQLERLIGELLDVSKIQAGRLEYVQEPVDLDALLQEITDTMQQTNPSHTLVMRGAVQTRLLGDRDRLGQVFTNLLSNAIKYSPDAKTVEIDRDASPETVTIRVHDHGLGIPREQRDKVFERFYRVAGSRQKEISGLGMGLYIVAEIVKRHGGTITVDSDIGRGSTFTVTFPLNRDT